MVRAVRGRNGGYALECDPKSVTLANIIELFEGFSAFRPLGSSQRSKFPSSIDDLVNITWEELADTMHQVASQTTIATILSKVTHAIPDYVI